MALPVIERLRNTVNAVADAIETEVTVLDMRMESGIPTSHETMQDFLLHLTRVMKEELTRE